MYRLTWRLPLAGLVAFSHLQFSQIRGRQPYLIVRNILYVIIASADACAGAATSLRLIIGEQSTPEHVEQTNRGAQFAPKNGHKPKPSWPAYTSSVTERGRNHPPRLSCRPHAASALPGTRQKRNYLFAGLASGPSTDSNTVNTKLASPFSGMK